MSKSTIKQWYTKGKDRGSNTHTHAALSRPRSNFLPSSSLDLWAQTESGAALHFKSPPPRPSNSLSNQRWEGGPKLQIQTISNQWGLKEAHAVCSAWLTTQYQMKCLWLAGPGHVSALCGGSSGSLITRQGQQEAPSEHEALALPLATKTKDQATTVPPRGRLWVGVCDTVTGRSPLTPWKLLQRKPQVQGSHLQTRSCYGFQMVKMAAMPGERATTRPPLIRLEV